MNCNPPPLVFLLNFSWQCSVASLWSGFYYRDILMYLRNKSSHVSYNIELSLIETTYRMGNTVNLTEKLDSKRNVSNSQLIIMKQ